MGLLTNRDRNSRLAPWGLREKLRDDTDLPTNVWHHLNKIRLRLRLGPTSFAHLSLLMFVCAWYAYRFVDVWGNVCRVLGGLILFH